MTQYSMTVDWKIFYADGSVFDSSEGEPADAPKRGIICIVQNDDLVGREIKHGSNWYYWVENERQWWGSDRDGLLDWAMNNLPIKQGRNVSRRRFGEIMDMADKDPGFPPKSGTLKGANTR